MAPRSLSALAVLAGVAGANAAIYLPNSGSVSYNQGAGDWTTTGGQNQLLNSVGSGAATTPISGSSCYTGQNSPINVVDSPSATIAGALATNSAVYNKSLATLAYSYPSISAYKVEMNEHTLEVKFDLTASIPTATNTYGMTSDVYGFLPATQIHFHSPSEHTINGMHYPLEMHIVNQVVTYNATSNGFKAGVPGTVIAIMFQYTPDNTPSSFLAPIWAAAPSGLTFAQYVTAAAVNQYGLTSANNSVEALGSTAFNMGAFLAAAGPSAYYRYTGSLTTPSCSQAVQFNILAAPQPVSYAQVVTFTNLLAAAQGGISRGADNRAIQAILPATTVTMSQPHLAIMASSAVAVRSVGAIVAMAVAALLF